MNRAKEMDEFLQHWAKIYDSYPDFKIQEGQLYSALMEYGLTEEEIENPTIQDIFPKWQSYFSDKSRNNSLAEINVYHDMRQSEFLQFRNCDYGYNHVKLYLSYPPDKIENCVNKIFDYIFKHLMNTASKVANRVRSDSVVIRMGYYEDAVRVIDYINSDPELVMHAKPTNPFMMRQGVVGVAYDDRLSYNFTLVFLLAKYFTYCRQNNTLKTVDHKNFRDFVSSYINQTFNDMEELISFFRMLEQNGKTKAFLLPGHCLENYEQVFRLIEMQLDDSMDMEKYHAFHDDVKHPKRSIVTKSHELLKSYYRELDNSHGETAPEQIQLLQEYVEVALEQYKSVSKIVDYLKKYVETGDFCVITRRQGLTGRFKFLMTPGRALTIMQEQGGIGEYVESISYNSFIEVFCKIYQVSGYDKLKESIQCSMNGDYSSFDELSLLTGLSQEDFHNVCLRLLSTFGTNMGENTDLCTKCADAVEQLVKSKMKSSDEKKIS